MPPPTEGHKKAVLIAPWLQKVGAVKLKQRRMTDGSQRERMPIIGDTSLYISGGDFF